ncbi:M28 family metallopeptidase [Sphingomonas sediminicola]|uniref:M28 family metallopeptidase n=1 Tax=Sphingomonas sediminicola TaxID=386874 RepID=UPI003CE66FF0
MKIVHLFAATAIALVAVPVVAADTGSFSPQRLSQHIQTLGSDAYEGRGVNTRAEVKTIDYIVGQFKAAGLQPGGEVVNGQRQWTQRVPLLQSEIAGDPMVTIQNAGGGMRLTQGNEISVRAPQNGQNQIRIDNAPLVFVGYGVSAPERSWDDFKGQDVRGKVIVVLVNDPDFEGGEGDFGGKAMTYYGRWTYKYEEAARRGAAGVMIVHETAPASYGWNTVKNSNTNVQFDIVRKDPAAAHTPFETWIQRDVAVELFRKAGLDFEQAKQAAKRRDFQPLDLKSTVSATANAKVETITSHNVVGLLPGKAHPDETVIYSAHWDHLGIGKPDANGDNIYNGALDNASGISHLIEQARAFAKGPRPDRSVVFLAVTAEEKGLLGSEYYAANPLYPLSKTVGVLNTDSMGLNGPEKNFSISGTAKLDLLDDLIAEGKKQGRYFTADPHPESGGFYRSDHFSFAKAGVPAISFKAGNDLVNGGTARGEAIAREYTEKRYHQPDDEFQSVWDFRGQAEDAQLLHMLGERLANSREWPNWSSDSEFRATRDQSGADRAGSGGERG